MKDKFNYTARETIHYSCPCCAAEWQTNKLEYCPNCEVKMLYSAGEEVYVECAYKEAEYSAYPHPTSRADQRVMLKKLTRPTVSEEEVCMNDIFHLFDGNINDIKVDGKTYLVRIYQPKSIRHEKWVTSIWHENYGHFGLNPPLPNVDRCIDIEKLCKKSDITPPPQQPSEGEIDWDEVKRKFDSDMGLETTKIKKFRWQGIMWFKAAIKELNR